MNRADATFEPFVKILPLVRRDLRAIFPEDPDDLLSDLFVELADRRLLDKPRENLRAFCRGVARILLKKRRREAQRERVRAAKTFKLAENYSVEPEQENRLEEAALLFRLEALDERDRSVMRTYLKEPATRNLPEVWNVDPLTGQCHRSMPDKKTFTRSSLRARRRGQLAFSEWEQG